MDQDDPEQRIADLERQLAAQQAGTDLPPASSDHAALSRRFVATSARMHPWLQICTYGFLAALIAVFAVMFTVRSAVAIGWAVIALMAVGLTLFGVFGVRRWGWSRKIPICVTSEGLTVETKPAEVFSFKDAKLGRFILEQFIEMSGTALHLQCGQHRFVLGGRDHRLSITTPLQAPPTGRVDGLLGVAEFDEILTMVARRSGLDVRRPAPDEPVRCLLYPPAQQMGRFDFGVKQEVLQPRLALDVGADGVRVIDPNTSAVVASASRAQVIATPATFRWVDDMGSHLVAVLVVSVPGLRPLIIRCPGKWRGEVPSETNDPEFRVSAADSRTLVAEFGLAANLKD